jgi:hypothetical protein
MPIRGRRRVGARRLLVLSRLSMVLGAVLLGTGALVRMGVSAADTGVVGPTATVTAPPSVAPPSVAPPSVAPPSASVAPLLFADEFDTEAAWPTGDLGPLVTRYENGRYVVDAEPIDLPVYLVPVAEGLAGHGSLRVEATLELPAGAASAGVFASDGAGLIYGLLADGDGRVLLVRDTMESLDVLATGSVPATGSVVVALLIEPDRIVGHVGGVPVVTAAASLVPSTFGLLVWTQQESATIAVDRFEVR